MPVNIEDVLARRTRAIILNARASAVIAPVVSEIMAEVYGFDTDWQSGQNAAYNELILKYL